MPSLHIDVFGGFTIFSDGSPVAVAHAPRLQSLLTYLLLHRDLPISRQQVASALWPDSSESQSRTNLRKQLMQLRQMLPAIDECLIDDGVTLRLRGDAPLRSDLNDFQRAFNQRDFARAAALYCGDLLPACSDEWIEPAREQLRRRYIDALGKWATALEEKRHYAKAIEVAQKLFDADVLDESACRRLMRLHALSGHRAEALRIYQTCADALQHELRAEPSQELRELRDQLQQQHSIEASQSVLWPLIGREAEWRQLRRVWDEAQMGKAQCVLLSGEAGIGKTRLAEELMDWARRQGIAIAIAHCYAAEGALAYAPAITWLRSPAIQAHLAKLDDAWLSEVSRLMPEACTLRPHLPTPGPLTEGWQRQRLFEALAVAVHHIGKPLLLNIDDMQWADRDTLEWLHYLLRHTPRARLLLMGTARMEEVDERHPLRELMLALKRAGQFIEIELGPLSALETASLAAQVAGQSLSSAASANLYRETEGNPLFVVETMRAEQSDDAIPSNVQAVIEQRLSRLSHSAIHTAQLSAVFGRAFTTDVIARAGDIDDHALAQSVDELMQRHIIHERAGAQPVYDFTHGYVRDVAYHTAGLAQRRWMHVRIAEVLAQKSAGGLDGVSAQIARHYDRGGRPEQAIPFYEQAAQTARNVYANAEAIAHLQRARVLLAAQIELGSLPARDMAVRVGEALGDLLLHVTQYEASQEAFEWALACAGEVLDRACLQRKIGNVLRDLRRFNDALVAYARASEWLGDAEGDHAPAWWHEWIQIQLEIDLVYYWLGDVEANAALLNHLRPILMQSGSAAQRASFYQNMTFRGISANRGIATEDMVKSVKQALAAFTEAGDAARLPSATFGVGFVLLWHGKPKEAEAPLREALRMAERNGDASLIARCVTYVGLAMRQLGYVDKTEAFVARGMIAAEAANMPEYTAMAHANAAWVAWRRSDRAGVRNHAAAAQTIWAKFPDGHPTTIRRWAVLLPLIAVCADESDIAGAVAHAQALLDPHAQQMPADLVSCLEELMAAQQAGQADNALTHLKRAVQLAEQHHLL